MDTIAAISTAAGVSAIGILRISGEEALPVADKVFRPADGRRLSEAPRRQMVLGMLLDREGRAIDRCLAVAFAAGHSYTGEDSVEFHCHGSPVVLQEGLEALLAAGARQAAGGEFTKRAFLHGRLDLTQAEAVIDLIEAETAQGARNAVEQLGGSLRRQIEGVYDRLLEMASRFYAIVDYPDEDIEELERGQIEAVLQQAKGELVALLATYRRGKVLKSGVPTAILGRPNVGKSSLLNALVGFDRAIVTDVPGTTRDTVEEKAVVGGVLLRLMDTAGIRETEDQVERLGVERSRQAMEQAELLLVVIEQAQEDRTIIRQAAETGKPWICILSKRDLTGLRAVDLGMLGDDIQPDAAVSVSSVTGEGIEELEQAVARLFPAGTAGQILTNPRQAEAIERALAAVSAAWEALEGGMTPDAVLTDVESGLHALGELTGKTLREDLVARIFERFCVGK